MTLNHLALAAATALATLAMSAAHADTFTMTGALAAGDATFNRPAGFAGVSPFGTAVYYDTFAFLGATPGAYNFVSRSTGFDNYTLLYAGTFNAATPLANLVAFNDDLNGSATQSGFTYTLLPGVAYTFVTTSFNNGEVGSYSNTISPVPEPQTAALMVAGLAIAGALRRRFQH